MNEAKGTIDMTYILESSNKNKLKFEIYTYDKDLNLINTVKDEELLEKAKTRWSWFKFKGESFITNSLSASSDMSGKLVFRKKQTRGTWVWLTGSYYRNIKQLEKVKPKTDDGLKYLFTSAYEIERDSSDMELTIVLGDRATILDNSNNPQSNNNIFFNGLKLSVIDAENKKQFRLTSDVSGVLISEVEVKSKAEKAGFQAGDVIIQIEDMEIKNFANVESALKKYSNKFKRVYVNRYGQTILFIIQ
jgi:hypothetical protein